MFYSSWTNCDSVWELKDVSTCSIFPLPPCHGHPISFSGCQSLHYFLFLCVTFTPSLLRQSCVQDKKFFPSVERLLHLRLSVCLTKHTHTRSAPPPLHQCSPSVNVSFSSTSTSQDSSSLPVICSYFRRQCHFTRPLHGSQILSAMTAALQLPYSRQTEGVYVCVPVKSGFTCSTGAKKKILFIFTGWADACQKYYVHISANKILISRDKK